VAAIIFLIAPSQSRQSLSGDPREGQSRFAQGFFRPGRSPPGWSAPGWISMASTPRWLLRFRNVGLRPRGRRPIDPSTIHRSASNSSTMSETVLRCSPEDPRQVRTRDRLPGTDLVEDEIPIDLPRHFIRRALLIREGVASRRHPVCSPILNQVVLKNRESPASSCNPARLRLDNR
jgi:hypothetical protein